LDSSQPRPPSVGIFAEDSTSVFFQKVEHRVSCSSANGSIFIFPCPLDAGVLREIFDAATIQSSLLLLLLLLLLLPNFPTLQPPARQIRQIFPAFPQQPGTLNPTLIFPAARQISAGDGSIYMEASP